MHSQPKIKLLLCAVFQGFTSSFSSSWCGGCSSEQKPLWPEFDSSPPLAAKVRNVQRNISTPQYVFGKMFSKHKDNFALSPYLSFLTLTLLNLYFLSFFFKLSIHSFYLFCFIFHRFLSSFKLSFPSFLTFFISFNFHCLSEFSSSCWNLLDGCCDLAVNRRRY
jgi:hypothetical protein